jgi:hypothetical protein
MFCRVKHSFSSRKKEALLVCQGNQLTAESKLRQTSSYLLNRWATNWRNSLMLCQDSPPPSRTACNHVSFWNASVTIQSFANPEVPHKHRPKGQDFQWNTSVANDLSKIGYYLKGNRYATLTLLLPYHSRILASRRSWIITTRHAEQQKKSWSSDLT